MTWNYQTPEELKAAGYAYQDSSRCRGARCRAEIEWWKTPRGKLIPLDPDTLQPHHSTCPDAKEFRNE